MSLLGSGNPKAPYTFRPPQPPTFSMRWIGGPPGATIFVTNGAYAPVSVNTPLMVQSMNGPEVTVIDGGGAAGCVYLATDAVMAGFTLTHGAAYFPGGGIIANPHKSCCSIRA